MEMIYIFFNISSFPEERKLIFQENDFKNTRSAG